MEAAQLFLDDSMFSEKEKIFLSHHSFQVKLFRYSTSVCAIKIENSKGYFIVLPFQGQQIWRICFHGHHLTMKSIFEEPENTTRFGLNYGGFLIHCGLTANGNPSAKDTHPLHGELPNCRYQSAFLSIGSDEKGEYVSIGGRYTYRNSLEFYYHFEPEIRCHADSSVLEMEVKATNLRSKPMKYMYMVHINWLPVDGSRLVYSAQSQEIEVFNDTFGLPTHKQQAFAQYVTKLVKDPTIADKIEGQTQVYDPELCMYIHYKSDEKGYAHAMQVFPEGDACYVAFQTRELPNAVRWFARTGDEDAVAFAIPATNNHLGYTYNEERNLLHQIPAHGQVAMHYRFGYLEKREADTVEDHIHAILKK